MLLSFRNFWLCVLFFLSTRLLAQPADAVNPLIGTAKSTQRTIWESNGATFPGVLAPFGMVQITPDGYRYSDTQIKGFSYLDHASGWGAGGNFLILPYTGPIAGPSSFSHKREISHPWQYDVDLSDYRIHAAFTATTHAGLARFTFPTSSQAHILLSDLSDINILSDTVLTGQCHGYWFIAYFSKPVLAHAEIKLPRVRLDFATTAGETIILRTAFSRTSPTAAAANLRSEMPDDDFNRISRDCRAAWNQWLSRIEIKGGDPDHRTVFYTALYHSSFAPAIISDAGETPRRYAPLYPWDTYRSEHPLITLLDPDAEGDMIASTLAEYDRTGWLPTGNMLGNHNVELILDSYAKGVRNFDVARAGQAIRKSLTQPPYARRDMALYNSLGYVPDSRVNSVSQTLEFSYNDWAAATFLRAIGEPAGADTLLARSFNYQHVYDPETGFMRAKTDSGIFTDGGFCEGTEWTYSWYVPHDIRGLINLMGGSAAFSAKLNTCFKDGHYVHDNEPPLHYAYLFDFSGDPWKTQQWARQITETSYSNVPGGLPGNDDLGALSSWYVFSAMGFYPVTPGLPLYELGSPIFNTCTFHLPNGRDFTVSAPASSTRNRYIQSATLNGRPHRRPWIAHQDILSGGTLVLTMGPIPNKHWGAAPEDAPPSQTTGLHTITPGKTGFPQRPAVKARPPVQRRTDSFSVSAWVKNRVRDPGRPPALDTSLLQQLGAVFYTTTSLGTSVPNNINIHGTPKWVPGLFGKAVQLDAAHGTWLELKPTEALDSLAHSDSMTMVCWIYPMDEENFSDIFCRGDWATLQLKASNTMINFYTGGWEGHEAVAPAPAGWNRHWHHIAGVTRAPYEELYIDGRLAAKKHMEPRDPNGETGLSDYSNHPWSIGRNENDPTRIFKGYIEEPMLFRKALTREEIDRVMMHLSQR